jgi:hypothetical protein
VGVGSCTDGEVTVVDHEGLPVTAIADYAFANCHTLTGITVAADVTEIGAAAFYNCDALAFVNLPEGLVSLGREAFSFCAALAGIVLPDSLTEIGEQAFVGCDSLTQIVIPRGVESIGKYAFWSCDTLVNITVAEENQSYTAKDSNIYSKDMSTLVMYGPAHSEESFTVPDGVCRIGENAFFRCENLKTVIIPDSVNEIGYNAFAYAKIERIDLGHGIKIIDGWAFSYCERLTDVTVGAGLESIGEYAFHCCQSLKSIKYRGSSAAWGGVNKDDAWSGNATIAVEYIGG